MGYLYPDQAAGEFAFIESQGLTPVSGGNLFLNYTIGSRHAIIRSADFSTVSGKTLKLRIRAWAIVNGTDPNLQADFKLKPLTFSGGSDTLTTTVGTQVGNTASITNANLGTNEYELADSSSFSLPSDGIYTVTITTSATLANNSAINLGARLEYRWE